MNRTRTSRVIRVAFADDHPFVRVGLRRFIASFADFEPVGGAASAEEALELVQDTDIDVLILDAWAHLENPMDPHILNQHIRSAAASSRAAADAGSGERRVESQQEGAPI